MTLGSSSFTMEDPYSFTDRLAKYDPPIDDRSDEEPNQNEGDVILVSDDELEVLPAEEDEEVPNRERSLSMGLIVLFVSLALLVVAGLFGNHIFRNGSDISQKAPIFEQEICDGMHNVQHEAKTETRAPAAETLPPTTTTTTVMEQHEEEQSIITILGSLVCASILYSHKWTLAVAFYLSLAAPETAQVTAKHFVSGVKFLGSWIGRVLVEVQGRAARLMSESSDKRSQMAGFATRLSEDDKGIIALVLGAALVRPLITWKAWSAIIAFSVAAVMADASLAVVNQVLDFLETHLVDYLLAYAWAAANTVDALFDLAAWLARNLRRSLPRCVKRRFFAGHREV